MKKILLTICAFAILQMNAQEQPNNGFLPSRVSTAVRLAFSHPAKGLMVFDTDLNQLVVNTGTDTAPTWVDATATGGGGTDKWANNTGNSSVDLAKLADGTTARPAGTEIIVKDDGSVAVGSLTPHASAKMDLSSVTQGFLTPRMTSAQRDAIMAPSEGLIIFNTSSQCIEVYNATDVAWKSICGDVASADTDYSPICNTMSINGDYLTGVVLDGTNNITINVDVAVVGPYIIVSNVGGMVFTASGTFTTTGVQPLILSGQGYPANVGLNYLSFVIGKTICSAIVNVKDGLATVTACGTPTLTGAAVAGVPLDSGDLTLALDGITYTGGVVYGISTDTQNGITLGTPLQGSFSSVSPATIELEISGTPLVPGNTVLNYSINEKTPCTVTIPVTSGSGLASSITCGGVLAGTYQAGTALGAGNTKIVSLANVTTVGTFNLRTDTQNGVYFSANYTAGATGLQAVTLTANGTPASSGIVTYTIATNVTATTFSTCTFTVTFTAPASFPVYPQCAVLGAGYTYVKASNANANDYFGGRFVTSPYDNLYYYSAYGSGNGVKLSTDGLTMIVGAPEEDGNSAGGPTNNAMSWSGAAYIYTRPNITTAFVQQAYLKASNVAANNAFGGAVDISNDGNTVIVGASGQDKAGTGVNSIITTAAADAGAAYIFTRVGATWSQLAYLKGNNTAAADYFGYSVSVSGDGNRFAVGAVGEDGSTPGINGVDNNSASRAGAVYTYTRAGAVVTFESRIKATNIGANDYFGTSVDLNDAGTTLAVGSPAEDGSGNNVNPANNNSASLSGAAYIFFNNGTAWAQQAYIKPSNTAANYIFGWDVSLSGNGNRLIVAAPEEDGTLTSNSGAGNSGAAYLYDRVGTVWSTKKRLKADNLGASDFFGARVQFSNDGSTAVVGAYGEDTSIPAAGCPNYTPNNTLTNSGAVYMFREDAGVFIQGAMLKMRTEAVAAAGNTASEWAGTSVGLSGDGKTIVSGMSGEDGSSTTVNGAINNGASASGAVMVFTAP